MFDLAQACRANCCNFGKPCAKSTLYQGVRLSNREREFPRFFLLLVMKKHIIVAAVLSTLLSGAAFAQQATEGPWMVRARAVHLDSANGDSTGLGLSVNN
jgi:hypothetical protein